MEYEISRGKLDLYEEIARKMLNEKSEEEIIKIITRLLHFVGLAGEVGELGEKIKKEIRDNNSKFEPRDGNRGKELGDIEWYLTALESDEGFAKMEILDLNIKKQMDRKKRGVIKGSGDDR